MSAGKARGRNWPRVALVSVGLGRFPSVSVGQSRLAVGFGRCWSVSVGLGRFRSVSVSFGRFWSVGCGLPVCGFEGLQAANAQAARRQAGSRPRRNAALIVCSFVRCWRSRVMANFAVGQVI